MDAKEVMILITGSHKSFALYKAIEEGVNHMWTVSAFQQHPNTLMICDEDATLELRVKTVKYFQVKIISAKHFDGTLQLISFSPPSLHINMVVYSSQAFRLTFYCISLNHSVPLNFRVFPGILGSCRLITLNYLHLEWMIRISATFPCLFTNLGVWFVSQQLFRLSFANSSFYRTASAVCKLVFGCTFYY